MFESLFSLNYLNVFKVGHHLPLPILIYEDDHLNLQVHTLSSPNNIPNVEATLKYSSIHIAQHKNIDYIGEDDVINNSV